MRNHFVYSIIFIAVLFTSPFCKNSEMSEKIDITSHSIKLFFDPVDKYLAAIDTVQLDYKKKTDSISFLINKDLVVEFIGVGYQAFKFKKILVDTVDNSQADRYIVYLPKSLSPPKIEIRYKGCIKELSVLPNMVQGQDDLSTNENVKYILYPENMWYPFFNDTTLSVKVYTQSPIQYEFSKNED